MSLQSLNYTVVHSTTSRFIIIWLLIKYLTCFLTSGDPFLAQIVPPLETLAFNIANRENSEAWSVDVLHLNN